jgi:ABC-type sugar transport system ATPase subunit
VRERSDRLGSLTYQHAATTQVEEAFVGVDVIHSLDFEVRRAEIHILPGENGVSKSMLLTLLVARKNISVGLRLLHQLVMGTNHRHAPLT